MDLCENLSAIDASRSDLQLNNLDTEIDEYYDYYVHETDTICCQLSFKIN